MHMAGGGMHRGGGGMHVHPVHPPWVRPCIHPLKKGQYTDIGRCGIYLDRRDDEAAFCLARGCPRFCSRLCTRPPHSAPPTQRLSQRLLLPPLSLCSQPLSPLLAAAAQSLPATRRRFRFQSLSHRHAVVVVYFRRRRWRRAANDDDAS